MNHKLTVVSEPCVDYLNDNRIVNCTTIHPCTEWNCQYIKNHFHKTPDECKYDDYLLIVLIVIGVILLCAIIESCK